MGPIRTPVSGWPKEAYLMRNPHTAPSLYKYPNRRAELNSDISLSVTRPVFYFILYDGPGEHRDRSGETRSERSGTDETRNEMENTNSAEDLRPEIAAGAQIHQEVFISAVGSLPSHQRSRRFGPCLDREGPNPMEQGDSFEAVAKA